VIEGTFEDSFNGKMIRLNVTYATVSIVFLTHFILKDIYEKKKNYAFINLFFT